MDGASPASRAYGVANAFDVDRSGSGTLRYKTPILRYALVLLQLALWIGLIRYLVVTRPEPPARPSPDDQ